MLLSLLLACTRAPIAPPPLRAADVAPEVRADPPKLLARADIVAVGDIMMHGTVKSTAQKSGAAFGGYAGLFAHVKPEIAAADLAFGNMEFPVAPDSDKGTASMVFNAPADVLDALYDAGFDVVSFANNHVYDQGVSGFVETIRRLEASPLEHLGAGNTCEEAQAAKIFDLNGIKVALIAGTRLYNTYLEPGKGRGCSFHITSPAAALESAKKAREAGAEIVLLSIHWGVEYRMVPQKYDVDLAHALLEGGIDGILGHHPHVLQPVEVYETKDGRLTFVAYSLGNFISGQGFHYRHGVHHPHVANTRDGGFLRFSVVRKDYGGGVVRTELAELSMDPLWVIHDRAASPRIYPVVARLEMARLEGALGAAGTPEEQAALRAKLGLVADRRAHAGTIVGAQWLYPLPGEVPGAVTGEDDGG